MKKQATDWEKILANHISHKEQVYNERSNINNKKKPNSPITKWAKGINRYFTEEDTQTAD